MKIFVMLTFSVLLAGCASAGTHDAKANYCQDGGESAKFGIDGRNEDYLRGCFPCCFCCEKGTCCDECKKRNRLTAPQASPND